MLPDSPTNTVKRTEERHDDEESDLFLDPASFVFDLEDFSSIPRPSDKLSCLLRMTERLQNYLNRVHPGFGADEFLPCMIFALSRVNVPNIFAQSQFMEEFLNEDVLGGMEGYVMTNFQIALEFLLKLELDSFPS